ncbi:MAG: hypothetical protein UW41_C0011G0006 [Candidatus Collierbacteria bacterium GW2011_GWC2_44_18]|uniref:Uncharacterized protein n=2 Tax=Microgenomates group TaxID=1794810 RepID=A0A0G1J5Y0_9BACT|nr:MAG: hypothetical protein UW16_C0023G0005 [Microgenomates group bacterium GW2011_GWC1_44_10]KKT49124.1 MAG: hypothetical protein UW41_C0011G0006 [Candidatus Collierbacteria bacterium GW2011_GWC2_44_18]KKT66650.1 MAG: hypothetical protein UW60_C0020G0005 [Candidatus Woesebacteria bacterium GW2011_GWA2_44_33]
MPLNLSLNKKRVFITLFVIVIILIVLITRIFSTKKNQIPPSISPNLTATPPAAQPTVDIESNFEKFIKEYQFMFWHLPNSTNGTSVGWNGDIPVVVKDKAIFNPYKNVITKKLDINEIAILNNNGEALIISSDKQKVLNLQTLIEKDINQKERDEFNYIWYSKPDKIIALSEDKKTLFIVDLISNEKTSIAQTNKTFNPFSLSTDNNVVAITDSENLYIYNNQLDKIKLDDTTTESITYWLKNELYLVEKGTKPRVLDFIMLVDMKNREFKQVITSSSIINRLNLKVKPSINQKQDMVLFAENNGLIWILSKDQAITRIYPQLKLPPEAWSNSAP